MVDEEEENCLDRPASLATDAGDEEGSERKGSTVADLAGARFKVRERKETTDCLRNLLGETDMSLSRMKGGKAGFKERRASAKSTRMFCTAYE